MVRRSRKAARKSTGLSFNHAMVYSRNVGAALRFYRSLGFTVLEQMEHREQLVYARLKAGEGTLALHAVEPGKKRPVGGEIRLYFEVKDLASVCERLQSEGLRFSQLPKVMPWGWTHAYLDDPDGHEVSLYWAGAKRFQKSRMTP